jgi:ComF family protein
VGRIAHSIFESALELFFPTHCAGCGRAQEAGLQLCPQCRAGLPRLKQPFCCRCSRPFDGAIVEPFSCPNCADREFAFDFAVSCYQARDLVRELVHRLKYGREFHLRKILASWLVEGFGDSRFQGRTVDALVPVPLHPVRQRERGYNQSEAIAELAAKLIDRPPHLCLRRIRYTETQTRFDRNERIQNLRNAFALRKSTSVHNQNLVLIDDVLTTGSTLHECAQTLLDAGAASVCAVTVARG